MIYFFKYSRVGGQVDRLCVAYDGILNVVNKVDYLLS